MVPLIEANAPLSATLPSTRYFEITSKSANARYAIWVTVPQTYDRDPQATFPVIYVTEGNFSAPQTIPMIWMLPLDPIHPIKPLIQVCVGYAGDDVANSLALRARDFLPPGEPLPPMVSEAGMQWLVDTGVLDAEGVRLYLQHLRHPAGDKFLRFLTEELRPAIAAQYRIDDDASGLFGYSYGGLFASYAALSCSAFRRIGAGSPAIIPQVSTVLELYRSHHAANTDFRGRTLHMTISEKELTVPSYFQTLTGVGTMEFMTLAGQSPLKGLAYTAEIQAGGTHMTGLVPSWASFLRRCYAAPPAG